MGLVKNLWTKITDPSEEMIAEEVAKLEKEDEKRNPANNTRAKVSGAIHNRQPVTSEQPATSQPTAETAANIPRTAMGYLNEKLRQDAVFKGAFDKLGVLFVLLKYDLRRRREGEKSLADYLGFDRNILLKYLYAIFGKFNVSGIDGGEEIKRILTEDEGADDEEKKNYTLKAILCNEILDINNLDVDNTNDQQVITGQLQRFERQILRINNILPVKDVKRLQIILQEIAVNETNKKSWLPASRHIAIAAIKGGYDYAVAKAARAAALMDNLDVLDVMIADNGGNPLDIPTPNQNRQRPPAIPPSAPGSGSQGSSHQPPSSPAAPQPPIPQPAQQQSSQSAAQASAPQSVTPVTPQTQPAPMPATPAQPAPIAPAQPAAPAVIELTEVIEPVDDDWIIEEEPALPESIVNDPLLDLNQDKIDEIMKDRELVEALTDLTELFLFLKRPDSDISAIRDAIDDTPTRKGEILGSVMVAAKEENVVTLICKIFKIKIDNQAEWAVKIKQIHNECKDGKIYELLKPAAPAPAAAAPASPAQKPSAPAKQPKRPRQRRRAK